MHRKTSYIQEYKRLYEAARHISSRLSFSYLGFAGITTSIEKFWRAGQKKRRLRMRDLLRGLNPEPFVVAYPSHIVLIIRE